MKVRWLNRSLRRMAEISDHIAIDSRENAYSVSMQIRAAGDSIEFSPNMGRPGKIYGTKELLVHGLPYFLVYRIAKNEIQILDIIHMSRNWP